MYNRIDAILNELINSGSQIPYLRELRDKSISEISFDKDLKDVLDDISKDIETLTMMFLEKKNQYDNNLITGISTGIYLPDYNSGEYKYTLLGGKRSRTSDDLVDNDTF